MNDADKTSEHPTVAGSPQGRTPRTQSALVAFVASCLCIGALFSAARITPEADMLAVMPAHSPDVQAFRDIQARFGGLDIVQVAVAAPDVVTTDFLTRLQQVSEALAGVDGVGHVLSLTTVTDFVADTENGGIVTDRLVSSVPQTPEAAALLRARIMQKVAVVGNLIAPDGQAVQILCFLQHRPDSADIARRIAATVEPIFAGHQVSYGGAPYIGAAAADGVAADLARVGPWLALGVALALLVVLRDALRGLAVFACCGVGLLFWAGCVGLFGIPLGPTQAMAPLVAFVVGSALMLQVATRWQGQMGLRALVQAARETLGAAAVFTASLLILCTIPDVRGFASLCALGMGLQGAVALFLLPSVLTLLPERVAPAAPVWVGHVQPPRTVLVLFAALLVLAATQVGRISSRIDMATLLGQDSAPVRSIDLFREHFGTAQFLFLQADGDFNDPLMLRELEWLADSVALMPGVTNVAHVGVALSEANAAMEGVRRMPDSREKAALLYGFVGEEPAVKQLISHDADHALLTVKVAATGAQQDALIASLADRVEALSGPRTMAPQADAQATQRLRERIATRIIAAARFSQVTLPEQADSVLRDALATLPSRPQDHESVAQGVAHYLGSDESPVPLPDALMDAQSLNSAGYAVVALGQDPSDADVASALGEAFGQALDVTERDDLAMVLQAPLDDLWQQAVAQSRARALLAAARLPEVPAVWNDAVVSAMMDLRAETVLMPRADIEDGADFSVHLTGEPLLHRALAADVAHILQRSASLVAIAIVGALGLWYRRAVPVALVAGNIVTTLVFMLGAMGWLGIRIDATTLPLCITAVGLALAYCMHGLAGESGNMAHAWLMLSIFAALTAARTPALENVGALVNVSALASAASVWIILPALLAPIQKLWAKPSPSL